MAVQIADVWGKKKKKRYSQERSAALELQQRSGGKEGENYVDTGMWKGVKSNKADKVSWSHRIKVSEF